MNPNLLAELIVARPHQVWVSEIVCTQMTKTDGFTRRTSWDSVANFHLVAYDHDAINK